MTEIYWSASLKLEYFMYDVGQLWWQSHYLFTLKSATLEGDQLHICTCRTMTLCAICDLFCSPADYVKLTNILSLSYIAISLEWYRFFYYFPWAIQVLLLSPLRNTGYILISPDWYRLYFYIPWTINSYWYLPWAILYLILLSPLSDTGSFVISLEWYRFIINDEPLIANVLL